MEILDVWFAGKKTSIIQPMDQRLILVMKILYRKRFLEEAMGV
jgi:hypothetical protein